jgi:hypothetical protein
MPKGHCSLCGTFCELTFEHVPPRSAFNKKTRYKSIPFEQILKSTNILEENFRGKIEQGGIGYYSLCSTCNSFLGSNYVNAYTSYSNTFIEFAKKEDLNYFEFLMHSFEAAKVLKQIVSMFISLNSWDFSENHPELRNYVLDPASNHLPSNIRIFNYLNTEGQLRNITLSAIGNLNSSDVILASELTFPPLGHVLTFNFEGSLPYHYEITNFKKYNLQEFADIEFKIYRLPTFLPLPLDYRSKDLINKEMNS